MDIHDFELSRPAFSAMPEPERTLLLILAHSRNELGVLHKLAVWASAVRDLPEPELNGRLAQTTLILKVLIGKLHELNETLKDLFYGSGLSKKFYPLVDAETREALKELKRYFGRNNVVTTTRNQLSFHYSQLRYEAVSSNFPADHPLRFYVNEEGPEVLFDFVEQMVSFSIFVADEPRERWNAAINHKFNEVLAVSRWAVQASGGIVKHLLEQQGAIEWTKAKIWKLEPIRNTDVQIPFFARADNPADPG